MQDCHSCPSGPSTYVYEKHFLASTRIPLSLLAFLSFHTSSWKPVYGDSRIAAWHKDSPSDWLSLCRESCDMKKRPVSSSVEQTKNMSEACINFIHKKCSKNSGKGMALTGREKRLVTKGCSQNFMGKYFQYWSKTDSEKMFDNGESAQSLHVHQWEMKRQKEMTWWAHTHAV